MAIILLVYDCFCSFILLLIVLFFVFVLFLILFIRILLFCIFLLRILLLVRMFLPVLVPVFVLFVNFSYPGQQALQVLLFPVY
jgi:hypothetical protein